MKIKETDGSENCWISVKDILPLCCGRYLVFRANYYDNGSGKVTICYFDGSDTWRDDDGLNFGKVLSEGDVSHWMPLPNPPGIHVESCDGSGCQRCQRWRKNTRIMGMLGDGARQT